MTHYSHDDLVLYYYGEGRRRDRIERHLEECERCRAEYDAIAATLALVAAPVPPRDERYGLEVWQRIRHELPSRERAWWLSLRPTYVVAAAVVAIVAAFVAGRVAPHRTTPAVAPPAAIAADRSGEQIRVDALADHLDRSERLLLDLEHDPNRDIADEQAWAADLIAANRLYRDAAVRAGDASSASVLDDLERELLDIVHAPSRPTAAQIEEIRTRLEAAELLFKVRVLHDQLRERTTTAPASPRTTT